MGSFSIWLWLIVLVIVMLVFVPLFFLSGVEGRLLYPLGFAYLVAIFASLVVALTLTPALCAYVLPRAGALRHGDSFLVRWLKKVYQPMLRAALKHSTSPSAKSGGDIGFVRYQGDVPAPVAATAFTLRVGDLSEPIHSPVGMHLIQVVERKPGDLSLEDARPALLKELGQQLWIKTVADLRAKARITVTP